MNETLFTNTKEPGRFIQLLCVDDEHLILEILTDFFNVAYKKVKVYTSNQNKEALELGSLCFGSRDTGKSVDRKHLLFIRAELERKGVILPPVETG